MSITTIVPRTDDQSQAQVQSQDRETPSLRPRQPLSHQSSENPAHPKRCSFVQDFLDELGPDYN